MKRVYLILLTALVLGCSKKDDTVTEPPPPPPVVVEYGSITFYVHIDDVASVDLPVMIWVNDSLYEDRLNGAPSGTINCYQPSTLGRRIFLKPGTHSWRATSDKPGWRNQGTVIIKSDVCVTERLR